MEPSSPNANPFSAAAVSGGRLPYFFTEPTAEKKLLQTIDRHQWIGQIVGPHGSGKTTLTHHLWTHAKARFPSMVQVTIRGQREVQRQATGEGSPCLFVVDGIERLSRVDRWLFLRGFSSWKPISAAIANVARWSPSLLTAETAEPLWCRRRVGQRDGLLVTVHRPLPWLPKLFETTFDEVVLNRLTRELLSTSFRTDFPDGDGDVFLGPQWKDFSSALVKRHGSNGREILMEMYDLYEANQTNQLR